MDKTIITARPSYRYAEALAEWRDVISQAQHPRYRSTRPLHCARSAMPGLARIARPGPASWLKIPSLEACRALALFSLPGAEWVWRRSWRRLASQMQTRAIHTDTDKLGPVETGYESF